MLTPPVCSFCTRGYFGGAMETHDLWLNLGVAMAIMACILLPQFLFRAPSVSKDKKQG